MQGTRIPAAGQQMPMISFCLLRHPLLSSHLFFFGNLVFPLIPFPSPVPQRLDNQLLQDNNTHNISQEKKNKRVEGKNKEIEDKSVVLPFSPSLSITQSLAGESIAVAAKDHTSEER